MSLSLFLGLASLLLPILAAIIIALCIRKLRVLILFACFLRIIICLIHTYIWELPDGRGDAREFQSYALAISGMRLDQAFLEFPGIFSGWAYPWFFGMIFNVLVFSDLLMQAGSITVSLFSLVLCYRLASLLWNEETALKSTWLVSVYPVLIMYSVLTLREAYIQALLIYLALTLVKWNQNPKLVKLLLAIGSVLALTIFHGAFIVLFVPMVIIIVRSYIPIVTHRLKVGAIYFRLPITILVLAVVIMYFIQGSPVIPYVGIIEMETFIPRILNQSENTFFGGASFPSWLLPTSPSSLLYLFPARTLYFFFSPFPWDVKSYAHVLGLLDGIFYLFLLIKLIRNYRSIISNRHIRFLSAIFLPIIILFVFGVGNFGTAVRHRAKFLMLFVCFVLVPRGSKRRN